MPRASGAGATVTNDMNADTHDSDSETSGFPISVDLSPYVGAPARCRVWVRTRARKVRWLATRVRRAARLRGPLLLKAGECLLPPGEPLRVIRPDDTLSVARVEHKWQHPFSFHEDEDEAVPTEPAVAAESTSPAKLPSTLEQPLEKSSQPAKQKQKARNPATVIEPSVKPSLKRQKSPTTEQTSEEPMHLDHEALNRVKQRALALLQQVTGDDIEQDVVDAPKKKRRRVRRRRPCRDVNLDPVEVEVEAVSIENRLDLQVPRSNQDESIEEPDVPSNDIQNGSALLSQTQQSVILSPSPAVSLPMTSVSTVPCPTILTYPTPSMLVRNPTPPRAPRVVRALTAEFPKMDAAAVSTN